MAHRLEDQILWLDESILVFNKPAGLPTLPDGYDPAVPHVRSLLAGYGRLWIVHRLDRGTSGVLVLARTAQAHRGLNTQFEQRQIAKIYHALVAGCPDWDEKAVQLPLRANGDRRHRSVVDPQRGKPAETYLRLLERFKRHALLEAQPKTGRTHQIRAHLAALGFPILADALYGQPEGLVLPALKPGSRATCPILNRVALHARMISITHPASGALLTFEAPYPADISGALRMLRKYASQSIER